jgi:hypothetical protein
VYEITDSGGGQPYTVGSQRICQIIPSQIMAGVMAVVGAAVVRMFTLPIPFIGTLKLHANHLIMKLILLGE